MQGEKISGSSNKNETFFLMAITDFQTAQWDGFSTLTGLWHYHSTFKLP